MSRKPLVSRLQGWRKGRAAGALCVEMGFYADISWKSRCNINTQYMRNPDMVYVLKIEYVCKINIFGLKMMVKSGLEKLLTKIHACIKPFSGKYLLIIER